MPGPITHLKAAYLLNESRNEMYYPPELFLGCISPDSVNINGHADKSLRWPAHLRRSNLVEWLESAKTFYYDNKATYSESYLTGYISHIVTDIVWDMKYEPVFKTVMRNRGAEEEKMKEMRWLEIFGYERKQTAEPWFTDTVLPELARSEPLDIGTLKAGNIEILRDRVLKLELEVGCEPTVLTDELMDCFFSDVTEKLGEIL